MNKTERLTLYRCAIVSGKLSSVKGCPPDLVEKMALEMLRAETSGVDRECDIGSCTKVAEVGSEFCRFHLEANR